MGAEGDQYIVSYHVCIIIQCITWNEMLILLCSRFTKKILVYDYDLFFFILRRHLKSKSNNVEKEIKKQSQVWSTIANISTKSTKFPVFVIWRPTCLWAFVGIEFTTSFSYIIAAVALGWEWKDYGDVRVDYIYSCRQIQFGYYFVQITLFCIRHFKTYHIIFCCRPNNRIQRRLVLPPNLILPSQH